jgi:hypothetical protein
MHALHFLSAAVDFRAARAKKLLARSGPSRLQPHPPNLSHEYATHWPAEVAELAACAILEWFRCRGSRVSGRFVAAVSLPGSDGCGQRRLWNCAAASDVAAAKSLCGRGVAQPG